MFHLQPEQSLLINEDNMIKNNCDSLPSKTSSLVVDDVDSRKTFPSCLHTMLTQANGEGFDDIASWQPHGRSFRIHKPKEFMKSVMPKMFKQTKWSSFQRQLNLYGFKRITVGADKGAYYHESFLRGNPQQATTIVRTRVKGTKVRMASNPDDIPNFYSMPPVDAEPVIRTPPMNPIRMSSSNGMSSCTPSTMSLIPPQEQQEQCSSAMISCDLMTQQPQHLNMITPPASRNTSMDMLSQTIVPTVTVSHEEQQVNDDDLRDLLRGMFGTTCVEQQQQQMEDPFPLETQLQEQQQQLQIPTNDIAWGHLLDSVFD